MPVKWFDENTTVYSIFGMQHYVIVFSDTFEAHLECLQQVLQQFKLKDQN